MSFIYKITNNLNNKVYIGKTNLSIEERFRQHYLDSKKQHSKNRPLYKAIQKYGIENFSIESIEQCSTEEASDREIYWIEYYQSYQKGYNATKGGDGKPIFNHKKIAEELKNNPYPKDVAEIFNCSVDTVRIVAKEFNIKIKHKGQENNVNQKKLVNQYTKQNEYIQTFNSIQSAAEWLLNNNIISNINGGVRSHISEVIQGKRKSAYGYLWK